jgi:rhodanese-related sulfurtransferase
LKTNNVIIEIDSESLHRRLVDGDGTLLLDIRTQAEISQGVIPDSLPLPMHLLPLRLNELPRDRDLVLYCRSGGRSYQACNYMMQQGWTNVLNLRGGILAWASQGFGISVPSG